MAGTNSTSAERDGDWASLLPSVILINPQMGENIGASARAMKNCGLSDLHLVNPRDGWPNPAAEAMATGGADILDRASLHDTTQSAAEPFTLIAATTARRRDMAKDILSPREAAEKLAAHARQGGKTALMFGGERSGLDNEDVARADIIITVPLNPQFASLNLAQAVLLTGWECRMAVMNDAPRDDTPRDNEVILEGDDAPATAKQKQYFFDTLEAMLSQGGFFGNPDMQPAVMRNIMAMLTRAELTQQDIRTLHGMMKAVKRSGSSQGE